MADIAPKIPVDLDKPRTLLLDHRAVRGAELELTRTWGREYTFFEAMQGLLAVLDGEVKRLNVTNLVILLWQALRHEDPALPIDAVANALPCANASALIPYIGKLFEAWNAQNPPVEDTGEAKEATDSNPLDASIGASAGPSLVSISG